MNRIDATFARLRTRREKALIAYIGAGDPDLRRTRQLAQAFERVGVDVLELGVPFSDPLADGQVNQLAAERALRGGTTLNGVLALVANLRRRGLQLPLVFYIYYNLLHHHGLDRFARDAAAAGLDGVLALDLPPEEAGALERCLRRRRIHPIYLVAPTTPSARVAAIARHAAGFVYYVSREGVTGMQKRMAASIPAQVARIRRHTDLPVAVGFGISNPVQARSVAALADGVVVGSAIVNRIAKLGKRPEMPRQVARFVAPLVKAVKSV